MPADPDRGRLEVRTRSPRCSSGCTSVALQYGLATSTGGQHVPARAGRHSAVSKARRAPSCEPLVIRDSDRGRDRGAERAAPPRPAGSCAQLATSRASSATSGVEPERRRLGRGVLELVGLVDEQSVSLPISSKSSRWASRRAWLAMISRRAARAWRIVRVGPISAALGDVVLVSPATVGEARGTSEGPARAQYSSKNGGTSTRSTEWACHSSVGLPSATSARQDRGRGRGSGDRP